MSEKITNPEEFKHKDDSAFNNHQYAESLLNPKGLDMEKLLGNLFQGEIHKAMLETNPNYKEELKAQENRILDWLKKNKGKIL